LSIPVKISNQLARTLFQFRLRLLASWRKGDLSRGARSMVAKQRKTRHRRLQAACPLRVHRSGSGAPTLNQSVSTLRFFFRIAPHLAAQLRHSPARAEHRYQGDPGPARTHDILPANSLLKAGSLTGSILATVRPWSSRDGLSAAASSSWLFDSRTVRLPVCPSG
jgi:hypothetical protein